MLFFYPTASATAKGQRPKFFRAEHSATAEGENCAYGPTLVFYLDEFNVIFVQGFVGYKKVGDCDREPKKFLGKKYIICWYHHCILYSCKPGQE